MHSPLAKTMLLNDQTVFSVRMQLKKLPNPPSRIYRLLSSMIWLLPGGLGFVLALLIVVQANSLVIVALANLLPLWLVWATWLINVFVVFSLFGLAIWQTSRRLGRLVGRLLVGFLIGPVVGLVLGLLGGPTLGLVFGLLGGLVGGAVSFQRGYRIHDLDLRWYLNRAGALPWNYRRFLDFAAERILLRKVGQDYIFVHRLLLDYFASLEPPSLKEASAGSASPQKLDEKE